MQRQALVEDVWRDKYRFVRPDGASDEATIEDTVRRVVDAIYLKDEAKHRASAFSVLAQGDFVPGGRILAGAGTGRSVTLINCFSGDQRFYTQEHGSTSLAEAAGRQVTVLTAHGWATAEVRGFGRQPVNKVTFRPAVRQGGGIRRSRSNLRHVVTATPNHRWLLAGGGETTDLQVGDVVPAVTCAPVDAEHPGYRAGFRHGLVFGDGSCLVRRPRVERQRYVIRLCGEKNKAFAGYFDRADDRHYSFPSENGDVTVSFYSEVDHKALPAEGLADEYNAGFIDGWLAADGQFSPRDRTYMVTGQNHTALDWLIEHAPLGGWIATGDRRQTSRLTNYGMRKEALRFIQLRRAEGSFWAVEAIEPCGEEEVFCAVVPGSAAFTLAGGIYTGNCFVSRTIDDSMPGIMDALKEAALTMQLGGGIGMDFSPLRPEGAEVAGVGSIASGPLSFMDMWDSMCRTIMSAGSRRGAMMATLGCDHPDVLKFIEAKQEAGRLKNFNVSVLVTDAFMEAKEKNLDWELGFRKPRADGKHVCVRERDGEPWYVYERLPARELWDRILKGTFAFAEPGVIFIDRVNRLNNLWYCERISATNPCVVGATQVMTSRGWRRIDAMLDGDWSVVGSDGLVHRIGRAFPTGVKPVFRLTTEAGRTLRLTADHLVLTGRGDVQARDLVAGDVLQVAADELKAVANGGFAPVPLVGDRFVSLAPDGVEPVYDLTEPVTHHFVANGIVVHNCGEQPLPPYGDCNLGAVNLANFVLDPFTKRARLDVARLHEVVAHTVRFLDNVIDVANFPLPEQAAEARAKRRIGLGIMGLGNMLMMLGHRYGSAGAVKASRTAMRALRDSAYEASAWLAKERGPFEAFEVEKFLRSANAKKLPPRIRKLIRKYGIRNGVLLTIAPTGTTAVFAGNVSSGLEPCFSYRYFRKVLQPDGSKREYWAMDKGWIDFCAHLGVDPETHPLDGLPEFMATALDLTVDEHLAIQAACQEFVDSSISKTINCPADMSFEDFAAVYDKAYAMGCKGCTTYRPSDVRGSVLSTESEAAKAGKAKPDAAAAVAAPAAATSTIVMPAPFKRPEELSGKTYKANWPHSGNFYVTVNEGPIALPDGRSDTVPIEMFVAAMSAQDREMMDAVSIMGTALFRALARLKMLGDDGDNGFLVEHLMQLQSPEGGIFRNKRYIPSRMALLAAILDEHMRKGRDAVTVARIAAVEPAASPVAPVAASAEPSDGLPRGETCPKCSSPTLVRKEGCKSCLSCGYSQCA